MMNKLKTWSIVRILMKREKLFQKKLNNNMPKEQIFKILMICRIIREINIIISYLIH
jgi:hypothetical protein